MVKTMTEENNVSNWFQDNLRIIISVGIVILLVFAIYSYSKRSARTTVVVDDSHIDEIVTTDNSTDDDINEIIDEIRDDQEDTAPANETEEMEIATPEEHVVVEEKTTEEHEEKATAENEQEKTQEETSQKAEDIVREVIESHATQKHAHHEGGVVTVTAVRGDSMTTLARKAAKDYMSRNTVGNITPAHKIYIEDYLRKKHVSYPVTVDTEMQFAESDIAEAINQSQNLTETQLEHLAHYAQHVPGL